jgi:DMSO/TMAO reductase YedYZ molybdopterin-dependent catalytic subunit
MTDRAAPDRALHEPDAAQASTDSVDPGPPGTEKHIGRRAFIGLVAASLAALFLGKDLFSWLSGGVRRSLGSLGFRINSVAPAPGFDEESWRLVVDGLVGRPLTIIFAEFAALPQVELTRDFYCVEGWGVEDVRWKGVPVSEIMKRAEVDAKATHLVFHSGDGVYTDSLTMAEAMRPDTLLAHRLNEEPLSVDMGHPIRLTLPGNYGYKYVKWVVRVEAVERGPEGYRGYWEQRGYPADATIR